MTASDEFSIKLSSNNYFQYSTSRYSRTGALTLKESSYIFISGMKSSSISYDSRNVSSNWNPRLKWMKGMFLLCAVCSILSIAVFSMNDTGAQISARIRKSFIDFTWVGGIDMTGTIVSSSFCYGSSRIRLKLAYVFIFLPLIQVLVWYFDVRSFWEWIIEVFYQYCCLKVIKIFLWRCILRREFFVCFLFEVSLLVLCCDIVSAWDVSKSRFIYVCFGSA